MLKNRKLYLAAAGVILGVAIFGVSARMVDAQSASTPVNLTGMWVMDYENGKKGWMSIVFQPTGAFSYTGRISHPDYGETNLNSNQVRDHFKLGNDAIFTVDIFPKGFAVQWVIFEKMASASMVSGKIMAPHGNLFPGNVTQVKFIARKG
jgi:hypothetical protein